MEAISVSHTPAHESATTVAPFRAWRGSQPIIAKEPTEITIQSGITPQGDALCPKGPLLASTIIE